MAEQPLADFTTLGVGGAARRLVVAEDEADLVAAVRGADRAGERVLVLGGGSNLLVGDAGFDGTAVLVRSRGLTIAEAGDVVRVDLAAGQQWDDAVDVLVGEGLAGIEALAGIPGSAGALPIQNVGAYGREIADVLDAVRVWDRRGERVVTLSPGDLGLAYRDSALKRDPGRAVVLGVTLRLRRDRMGDPVRYAELAAALGVRPGDPAPVERVRSTVLELRRRKGMVLDPTDADTRSAGSFFTNPLLDPDDADRLPSDAPRFPAPDGRVKVSAAWLIEHAGFGRGFAVRPGAPAALSGKHVLALTNRGGARAADLLDLARAVRDGVAEAYGITLHAEPVLVGCAL